MKDQIKIPDFVKPFEEAVDELWRNNPPRIELKGWWWKKYIPYYRKMRELMQEILNHEWKENHEELKRIISQRVIKGEGLAFGMDYEYSHRYRNPVGNIHEE